MIDQIKEFAKAYPPIISFVLTTLGSIALHFLKPKVGLTWGVKSNFTHSIRPKADGQQHVLVHTANFIVHNSGRLPATDIEIVLNFEPDEVSIWPQRQYTPSKNSEGRYILIVNFLGAKESIDLFMISVGKELPALLNVKSPQSTGTLIATQTNRQYPKWLLITLWTLIFLGVVFVVEQLLKIIA